MSTTLTPFRTNGGLLRDFRREIDSLMNQFLREGESSGEVASWTPQVNLSETDKEYQLSLDLPGLKPDDINIEMRHGDLWITGERKGENEESGKTWHRIERYHGQFRRVIRLGDDVDSEKINAEYTDGVLMITVPKSNEAQTKKIAVKAKS